MTEPPARPTSSNAGGDDTVGPPRWVKVVGIVGLVLIVLIVLVLLVGGGGHGPGRHG